MSLKLVGTPTPLGGFFANEGYSKIVTVSGECHLDLSMMSKDRVSAVVLSIKRGYSRGNTRSEQYALYAAVCEKFGLKHSKVSNSRRNWLAVPDDVKWTDYREKMLDIIEPMFQLTGETFSRTEAKATYGHRSWNQTMVRKQAVVMFTRPPKVPMSVMGKGLLAIMGEQPLGPVMEAVAFVKAGGKISYKF